jgi:hypothetical protein
MRINYLKRKTHFNFIEIIFYYLLLGYPLLNKLNYNIISRILLLISIIILFFTYFSKNKFIFKISNQQIFVCFFIIYIFSSLLFYVGYSNNFSLIFPSLLNYILPFIFFLIFKGDIDFKLYRTLIFSMIIVIGLGLISYPYFNHSNSYLIKLLQGEIPHRLSSIYGPISMGYMTQLFFAIVLFKYKGKFKLFLLVISLTGSILSFQRGSWAGIIIATILYFLFSNFKNKIKFIILAVSILIFLISIYMFIPNQAISNHLSYQWNNFNLKDAISSRSSQYKIINKSTFINILFGEGFGKYSMKNTKSKIAQPDAPYFRLYNELGLIGFLLFVFIFIKFYFDAFKKQDIFILYLLTHLFINLLGTNVIWKYPSNLIIFILLADLYTNQNLEIR